MHDLAALWLSHGEQPALSSLEPRPHPFIRKRVSWPLVISWLCQVSSLDIEQSNNPCNHVLNQLTYLLPHWPKMSRYVKYIPRLQKSFSSPESTKAIEDSVKTLGYEQARTEQLDVIIKVTMCSSPHLPVRACVSLAYLWCMTTCVESLTSQLPSFFPL